jgi:hypothetical protein
VNLTLPVVDWPTLAAGAAVLAALAYAMAPRLLPARKPADPEALATKIPVEVLAAAVVLAARRRKAVNPIEAGKALLDELTNRPDL